MCALQDESEARAVLSCVTAAMSGSARAWPVVVPVHDGLRDAYWGSVVLPPCTCHNQHTDVHKTNTTGAAGTEITQSQERTVTGTADGTATSSAQVRTRRKADSGDRYVFAWANIDFYYNTCCGSM